MPNNLDNIQAVLVLYKCKLEDSETFISISNALKLNNQSLDLYVYDNSPEYYYNEDVVKDYSGNITYIHDASNPGVSKAYNEGARFAKFKDKDWVILFDQDTVVNSLYFTILLTAQVEFPKEKIIVPKLIQENILLSPCRYVNKRGSELKNINIGRMTFNNKSLLNSGIAINLIMFMHVKGYAEDVPLYFSDFIFVDKLRKVIKTFVLIDSEFKHSMSSNNESNIGEFYGRYLLYCKGINQSLKYSGFFGKFAYLTNSFLRTVKLTIKFRSKKFLFIWYNEILT